ncbi:MAG TPA: TadE/TadG family type IV pilus assembly protein [Stellaceae bacterium]|nr:TadE/TadG family type IV pilus assembly protein [Stellaceae bacterium]
MTSRDRRSAGIFGALRRVSHDSGGAEAIEFALVSIPLVIFLFGVIEFARLYWTQSELQYAAEAAARCLTLNCCANSPSICGNTSGNAGVQNYAATQLLGVSISSDRLSNFQITTAACGNLVAFDYQFNFIVTGLMPKSSITLSATACSQA